MSICNREGRGQPPQRGFTLAELMVTVLIVAILTVIAVPNYMTYLRRNKLVEATSTLLALRQSMEQYYQDNRTYLNTAGDGCAIVFPVLEYFSLACDDKTRSTYTIVAKSKASVGLGSAGDFEYSINQDGAVKTSKFEGGSVTDTCLRISTSC